MFISNLSLIILILGILGITIVIGRRIPVISAIPKDILLNQESFLGFLKRRIKKIPGFFSWIKVSLMKIFEKNLLRFKILFLRLYNKTHAILEIVRSKKETDIKKGNTIDDIERTP